MVVLNFYGRIKPICISKKLGLFISNLPEEEGNEWQSELCDELLMQETVGNIEKKRLGFEQQNEIAKLYSRLFLCHKPCEKADDKVIRKIVENMICVYFDYSYDDMPLGDWTTNCFDGRLCEEDYAEKVIDFINFLSAGVELFPHPTPQWIYSSNDREIGHYRIFWGGDLAGDYIDSLMQWGKLFDSLLNSRNDYLLFDYLINSIHKDNHYNEYHLLKSYALCQLFLEREHEYELDTKIPLLFNSQDNSVDEPTAKLIRQLRNKIAHGDFIAFEKTIEEYASQYMDGSFDFDYSEYSRKNWTIINVCCLLDDIVKRIVFLLFHDRNKLDAIKQM